MNNITELPQENPPLATEVAQAPNEAQAQFQQFMMHVLSDVSRLSNQTNYLQNYATQSESNLSHRLDYIESCLKNLFEHEGLEIPPRRPRLLDAVVDLIGPDDLDAGEICEFSASWSRVKHPIYGNLQILLGPTDNAELIRAEAMDKVVVSRLTEAFDLLIREDRLVDGQFYYVRLGLIHAEPINDTSVALQPAEAAVAVGDEITNGDVHEQ